MDLQLATTDDLINEILRRHTFYGVIVKADGDYKQGVDKEKEFKVLFNSNVPRQEVPEIMEMVAGKFYDGGVTDPDLDRQQALVLKLAHKTLSPDIEPSCGEKIDGRWIFHLWEPRQEMTISVRLSECETKLERVDDE